MKYSRVFLSFPIASIGLLSIAAETRAQEVRLPITFHRQEHTLSCEVASLKMALQTHGINISESELIGRLPFDPTPKRNGVWGNPHKGFVGNINGSMLGSGYGVYWDPIAALGARYARTEVIRHGSAAELARHIAAGRPVVIWGYYGRRGVTSWQTPDGTPIKAVNGEHTRVVYGFDGPAHAPTRFYLMDPITGPLAWSTNTLLHNWGALDHMAVAVAPRWVRVSGDTRIWEINQDGTMRQWVANWIAFVRRGGSFSAVVEITKKELMEYTEGSPIR